MRTYADLVGFGCDLRIQCSACGAAQTRTAQAVVQRCGADYLKAIRRRLKCER